ncbi:hypothetical protein NIES2135_25220 [Leptolyngbya boryana NIES-2135]|jgi:hypothetical protein|uniref:Uncharacterized protein n=2 Tax=Leptolyngbya group TaxID=3081713 RepID=A0A1Z4JGA0_LEPBY|nr:hypothetical protein [Leptolyngbya sp. FACHB-161]MBD2376752.1 hypothetical protein [Leptolyngbya sp. FACHB-238]MBD2401023.1 hypothetical protein [Leptolyngbya sp. FACHB-239]MBD2407670.1 hypothetical protein [Leptolyngbya sp. FACHB-402]BAS58093.1 hypothetical protein LBWT_40570 [Leptolyngbya boryana IAM M-101]BAS64441.1 hypothetical protein LBDG_40570 [Leptolyngbya boryana dg5]BAY55698.1 hypothetical protein NIES2135_25220 [Leptolyngbya boryana NIES-2135]
MLNDDRITPLSIALTLWDMGIVSEQCLIAWADAQILAQEKPAYDLLEIATKGAAVCLKQGVIETAQISLNDSEEFFIRAYLLALECDRSAESFIIWASSNCFGSAEIPEGLLAYHLEHLYYDCEDVDAAIALLRIELPKLMPRCESFAAPLLEQVSGLELCV